MRQLIIKTKNATYLVDRERVAWMRISESHPRLDDGEWKDGGFTLGGVGQSCFAHFANHPDGATGRTTSKVISVEEVSE